MKSQNYQGPGTALKYFGVVWLDEMPHVPGAVIDKMQTYPTPKNMKEMKAIVRIWELLATLFLIWPSASVLYTSCKEHMGLRVRAASHL